MCVEGIEASGKSTLLASLAARLRDDTAMEPARAIALHSAEAQRLEHGSREVLVTREPGGTAFGNRLRAVFVEPSLRIDPLAEALLVSASRAQHVSEIIEPALRAGSWVLCDRFAPATLAYQGYGRGLSLATLNALAALATGGLRPDVTLLIDVPIAVSRARVAARTAAGAGGADRLEREDDAFHARVRDGYLTLAREDQTFVVLDGTLSPAQLLEAAWQALEPMRERPQCDSCVGDTWSLQ